MNCSHCEERLSDYLEGALGLPERDSLDLHLQSCTACSRLLAGMSQVLAWGKTFPVFDIPAWLSARIIANTPRVERESWRDLAAAIGKWIVEPRLAMGIFTATLMLGWFGNAA